MREYFTPPPGEFGTLNHAIWFANFVLVPAVISVQSEHEVEVRGYLFALILDPITNQRVPRGIWPVRGECAARFRATVDTLPHQPDFASLVRNVTAVLLPEVPGFLAAILAAEFCKTEIPHDYDQIVATFARPTFAASGT